MRTELRTTNLVRRYALAGAAFGLVFPLAAWLLDAWFIQQLPLTPANLWALHLHNPLHWIIDLAPLVLGSFAFELGKRHRIEESLRAAEARFRSAFDDASIGMGLISPAGRWLQVNRALCDLTGYPAAELLEMDLAALTHAEDRPAEQAALRALLAGEFSVYQMEKRFLHPAGGLIWGLQNLALVRDDQGAPAYFIAHIENITARRQAEQAARESADRYRQMFEEAERLRVFNANITESIAEGLAVEDADGRITLVNASLLKLLEYPAAEVTGQHWSRFVASADYDVAGQQSAQRRRGETGSYEIHLRAKTGRAVPVLVSATPLQQDGRYVGALVLLVDITERKRNETILAEGERRFRTLATLAPVGIYQTDREGGYVFVNDYWQTLTGLSEVQARGYGWTEALHPEDRERVLAEWDAVIAAGRNFDAEYRYRTPDGRVVWAHSTAAAIRDSAGLIAGYIGTVIDITENRSAEEALTTTNERLIRSLAEVEQRHQEIARLNALSGLLQSCMTTAEAYTVIGDLTPQLFPGRAGRAALISASKNMVETEVAWGDQPGAATVFAPPDCWALRRGRLHGAAAGQRSGPDCRHVGAPAAYLCAPMMAQGEALGVLTLLAHTPGASFSESERQLAQTVADAIALALANLNLRETLRQQSVRDSLTGLFNRRYMEETLERELRRAERSGAAVGVIVLDLDHFKSFNDTFGHAAGDALLRELGTQLRAHIRGDDVACRYGGEEFVLILPNADSEIVRERAEHLRQEAAHLQVTYAGQPLGQVTLSLGVACYPAHGRTPAGVLAAADEALYAAKHAGRNRVQIAAPVAAAHPKS